MAVSPRGNRMKKLAVLLVYLGLCLAALSAQTPQTRMQGGNMPPGENVAGKVKAINETKLTIARPDNQSQDIEVDENTSFKKGSESVTLADIKVGDFVFGPGEVKDGTFVSKQLNIGRPRTMIGGPDAQGASPD